MEKVSNDSKDKLKSRLLFISAVVVLILGIVGVITRGDSANKLIGTVLVMADNDSVEIEGYKTQRQYEDNITDYDPQTIETIRQSCKVFQGNSAENIAVSFTGRYTGEIFYSVYNFSDNTPVYENEKSLTVPADTDNSYLIKIEVKWGRIKNNVTVDYYLNMEF